MAKPYFSYGINNPASHRDLVTSVVKYGNQTKRYFSSTDAEMYIAGKRILDITRIDFSYQENKMPMYGFNSFIPSRIFVGQKIIQGTFAIAYTEPGYIAKLISEAQDSVLSGKYDKVGKSCDSDNAALFKRAVDITIGYGGYNNDEVSYKANCYTIEGVYITGFQQILDTSGEPVYEAYTFLAKDITFDGAKKIHEKSAKEAEENEKKQEKDTEDKLKDNNTNNKTDNDKNNTLKENDKNNNSNKKYNKDSTDVLLLYVQKSKGQHFGKILYNFSSHDELLKHTTFEVVISNNKVGLSKSYKCSGSEKGYEKVILKDDLDKLLKLMPNQDDSIDCTIITKKWVGEGFNREQKKITKAIKMYRVNEYNNE